MTSIKSIDWISFSIYSIHAGFSLGTYCDKNYVLTLGFQSFSILFSEQERRDHELALRLARESKSGIVFQYLIIICYDIHRDPDKMGQAF